jgi:CO/xanthine dehydrogenase FAD-binding subunit
MRSDLADFDVVRPTSLEEALAFAAERPGKPARVTPLAGATDLFVLLNAAQLEPTTFLDLQGIAELAQAPRWDGDRYRLHALNTYTDCRRDPRVAERLPLLVAAARELGALQIQNRATWAGNVANASPAADGVPALLAYEASLELASVRGRRTVALDAYFTGYRKTVRAADELIVALDVKVPGAGARHFFRKVGPRRMQAISKVVAAGVLERDSAGVVTRVTLALGSVAPVTLRARHVEAALIGRRLDSATVDAAGHAVHQDIAPIDDTRSTRAYRARISERLVRAFATP